jgi:gametolysin
MDKAIEWFQQRQGKVSYSMVYRNGPSSWDCSSAIYHSLIYAGILPQGFRIGNTETMFVDLPKFGFQRIEADANGYIPTQRGDIFIWGKQGYTSGAGGHCLPYDNTELLTPSGWKPLKDFKKGDEVIQFNNETGRLEPTKVIATTEPFEDYVYRRGNVEATNGHRMLVSTAGRNNFTVEQWGNIKDKNSYKFPIAQKNSTLGGDIRLLSDDEIILLLAIQADGTFEKQRVRFHLKKERKIKSLKKLLKRLNIPFTVGNLEKSGAIRINFYIADFKEQIEKFLTDKKFNREWLSITKHQGKVIYDNIVLWDGSIKKTSRVYSSKDEINIDIIQEAMFMAGFRSHKHIDGNMFTLTFQQSKNAHHSGKQFVEKNGNLERKTIVGCITVQSSFIVSRQFGVPTIVGNTGIYKNADDIIHCAYAYNGIHTDNHDWLAGINNVQYLTIFRYTGKPQNTPAPQAEAIDDVINIGSHFKINQALQVSGVNVNEGRRELKIDALCPRGFTWAENGIPANWAVKVDGDGYKVDGEINYGDWVKLQGAFVAEEVVQNDGMWFARVKRDGIDVWMELTPVSEVPAGDKGTITEYRPAPAPQPAPAPVEEPKPEIKEESKPEVKEETPEVREEKSEIKEDKPEIKEENKEEKVAETKPELPKINERPLTKEELKVLEESKKEAFEAVEALNQDEQFNELKELIPKPVRLGLYLFGDLLLIGSAVIASYGIGYTQAGLTGGIVGALSSGGAGIIATAKLTKKK